MNEEEYKLWEKFAERAEDEIAKVADDEFVDITENPDGSFKAVTRN